MVLIILLEKDRFKDYHSSFMSLPLNSGVCRQAQAEVEIGSEIVTIKISIHQHKVIHALSVLIGETMLCGILFLHIKCNCQNRIQDSRTSFYFETLPLTSHQFLGQIQRAGFDSSTQYGAGYILRNHHFFIRDCVLKASSDTWFRVLWSSEV